MELQITQNKMEKIQDIVLKSGVDNTEVSDIVTPFEEVQVKLVVLSQEYETFMSSVPADITKKEIQEAKNLKKQFRDLRIKSDNIHKQVKSKYLAFSRAIDGIKNVFKLDITNKEDNLEKVEKHFEILEAEARQKEAEEKERLQQSRLAEVSMYILPENICDFTAMSEEVWKTFVSVQKIEHDKRKEAEEQEKQRLANLEKENLALRLEQEQQAKKIQEIENAKRQEEQEQQQKEAEIKKQMTKQAFNDFLAGLNLSTADIDGTNYIMKQDQGVIRIYKQIGEFQS